MVHKIYLIEDDEAIIESIQTYLQRWDYEVRAPEDYTAIVEEAQAMQPDLILIDISLPYFNGFYWCQELRKQTEVPILFLSSAEEIMNQVMAMNMGADDFMVKPFELSLLLAKTQALLRRSTQYGQTEWQFSLGTFTFYPVQNLLKSSGEQVTLSTNETRILTALLQTKGKIVTKERLIQMLWESEAFIDNNALSVNMTRIRKKLASVGLIDVIHTVKNQGYYVEDPHD